MESRFAFPCSSKWNRSNGQDAVLVRQRDSFLGGKKNINARREERAQYPKRHWVGRKCSWKEIIDAENQGPWRQFKFIKLQPRITIKFDRLIVLSKSSLLGWFLHVSLILIIKGRYPREVSLIVIIKPVFSLIIKLFHHFSPNLSKSDHDSPDQTDDRIKI